MRSPRRQLSRRPGFSLLELVTVLMIIGIIAAIALPRLGNFSTRSQTAALEQNLAVLNTAIEHYRAEHLGAMPSTLDHLLKVTDIEGNVGIDPTAGFLFGPYLDDIPPLPVGSRKGTTGVVFGGEVGAVESAAWHIDAATGAVRANLPDSEKDENGVSFNEYAAGAARSIGGG